MNCYPIIDVEKQSSYEIILLEWLRSTFPGIKFRNGVRSVIPPYELDIYAEQLSLAIEINGSYWHQVDSIEDPKSKHLLKTIRCEEQGIKLIHVWEDEFVKQLEKLKDQLIDVIAGQLPFIDVFNGYVSMTGICMVDRSKINKVAVDKRWEIIGETPPEIVDRRIYGEKPLFVQDCGALILRRVNK